MSGNIKILIATGIYPPEIGGPATYSKILADSLPGQGVIVSILPFREVRAYPKIIRHIAYFFKVLRQGRRVDIIFAQDPVSVGFPAMLAAKILQKKFFLKIVGDYAWEQGVQRFDIKNSLDEFSVKKDEYSFLVLFFKRIEFWVAKSAEKIIVPCEYLKKIVSNWGIDKQKIHVIYNTFSASQMPESREELRKLLKLDGRIIICVARFVPWKGLDLLAKVMQNFVKKYPDTKLLIIGEGPDFYNLDGLIRTLNLDKNVFLLGKLPHGSVLKYLKAGDLFVLNTGYEGFSHQLLEVMASGIPLLTTNVGGNPELIENNKEGILVDYNNRQQIEQGIEKILTDKEFSNRITLNAKKRVKEFSESRMVNNTLKILK